LILRVQKFDARDRLAQPGIAAVGASAQGKPTLPLDFGLLHLWHHCTDHAQSDLMLQIEDIREAATEAVSPQMACP